MTLTDEAKAIRNELQQHRRGPYTKEMRCKIVAWYVRAKDSGMPLADMLRLLGVKPQLIDKWYEADLRRAATIVPVPATPRIDMTKQVVPVVVEDKPFLFSTRETYQPLMTCFPRTWLLRIGWERRGLIGAREIPGPMR